MITRNLLTKASLFSLVLMSATPVYAGFEWIPPEQNSAVVPRAVSPSPQFSNTPLPNLPPVEKQSMGQNVGTPTISGTQMRSKTIRKPDNGKPLNLLSYSDDNADTLQTHRVNNPRVTSRQTADQKNPPNLSSKRIVISTSPSLNSSPSAAVMNQRNAPAPQGFIPMQQTSQNPAVPAMNKQTFDMVFGFGKDIPLALALRQIAPPNFAFSFAENVNPGIDISWQGDRPWDVVLNESLAPHNLGANIEGNNIFIFRQGIGAAGLPTLQRSGALRRSNIQDPGFSEG